MTKTEFTLLHNPLYSSEWVKYAAILIDEYNDSLLALEDFNANQLEIIVDAKHEAKNNNNINISLFLNPKLNETQMQLLLKGYKSGLTTEQLEKYADPNIPYVISNWAISALIDGNNMNKYVDEGYDSDQMYEIYCGLKDKLNVSLYDKKDIPGDIMALARHAMSIGLKNIKIQFGDKKELTIE